MSRWLKRAAIALLALALPVSGVAAWTFYGLGASAACASPETGPVHSGNSYRSVASGGRERCYLLYVPPGYDPGKPVPVVFSLHGFASNPKEQQKYSRWERLADVEGFLVVYPKGSSTPLRWNEGPGTRIETVDDAQFVRDMIADLSAIATVDPARTYVTGFSNGGSMAYQLGCRLADRVAAVGVVAGVGPEPPGGCNPTRPMPLIAFVGASDPLAGGLGAPTWLIDLMLNVSVEIMAPSPASEQVIAEQAERNECSPTPETIPASGTVPGEVHGIRYTGCQDNAEVILYTIDGGGHGWPGGPSIPLLGEASGAIDASVVMWAFFKEHPLQASMDE
jgi:polyhydroxybutyrate depolymerase